VLFIPLNHHIYHDIFSGNLSRKEKLMKVVTSLHVAISRAELETLLLDYLLDELPDHEFDLSIQAYKKEKYLHPEDPNNAITFDVNAQAGGEAVAVDIYIGETTDTEEGATDDGV